MRLRWLAVCLLLPFLAAAAEVVGGWHLGRYRIMPPARFSALADGLLVEAEAGGGYAWQSLEAPPACLSWRWRVDEGPPPMDITRLRADRALTLVVGFSGWPPHAGLGQRLRRSAMQAIEGDQPLPRSALIFTWGGTGAEPTWFPSPHLGEIAQVRVLRPAQAPRGQWLPERVDLAAAWQAAFGGPAPPVQGIAITADSDNSHSTLRAMVENIRLSPCH
jgi:hypothetical protein